MKIRPRIVLLAYDDMNLLDLCGPLQSLRPPVAVRGRPTQVITKPSSPVHAAD